MVRCVDERNKKLHFETGYARVREVPEKLAERSREAFHNGRTSVIILVLDSMSRLNFIRQLPKSYKFIIETLRGVVMKGLTKVCIV